MRLNVKDWECLGRQASVPIAIAPDWSPSGSAGMLQEIAYAARHHGIGSDALIAMATSVPAKMVRINNYVGSLEPKKFADFVVINVKVDPTSPKPLDPVVAATPADVALVVVGGQALYGDRPLLERVPPAKAAISDMTVCGAKKAVYLGQSAAPSLKDDWDGVRKPRDDRRPHFGELLGATREKRALIS
jgi:5-methylthioadenosine/S-adenosylhomocysteine deaminase